MSFISFNERHLFFPTFSAPTLAALTLSFPVIHAGIPFRKLSVLHNASKGCLSSSFPHAIITSKDSSFAQCCRHITLFHFHFTFRVFSIRSILI